MGSVNKVTILGRLGKDPELQTTPNGQEVCKLTVATSEQWTKDGNREERTEWHRVVLWGRLASLAHKYLKKGTNVYLEGKLQTRSWDDPQGQKRYMTEIVATQLTFIDSARDNQGDSRGDYGQPSHPYGAPYSGGDNSYGSSNRGGGNSYSGGQSQPSSEYGSGVPDVGGDVPF